MNNGKIDDFVVRRRVRRDATGANNQTPASTAGDHTFVIGKRESGSNDFLSDRQTLELEQPSELPKKDKKKRKVPKLPSSNRFVRFFTYWPRKKIIITVASVLAAIILGIGIYFAAKFLIAGSQIFKGNLFSVILDEGQPLKEDRYGRSNIILFGTSEDDPGHPGAELTDSMMVVSIDQDKKDAFIVSIPRDFHVKYNMACLPGYEGKINAVYMCGKYQKGPKGDEDDGINAIRRIAGEVVGLDIQYGVHVNYSVLREAVDAVGGITVNIESDDRRGILDRNFDWTCQYKCYLVKHPLGPAKLDGKHALALARARGDSAPTYGLSRSNPDRQDNQRKILIALKDKAVSAGVLTNPIAVNKLLDTFGKNLRTNFVAKEIRTLMDLGKDIKNENITSFSLEEKEKPLATVSCFAGNICPNAGSYDYSAIHAAFKALATGNRAALEYAKIDVLNASGTAGLAQAKADELRTKGYTINLIGNAPKSLGTEPIRIYDMTGKKQATLNKLKQIYGVEITSGKPAGVTSSADIVVIVGKSGDSLNR